MLLSNISPLRPLRIFGTFMLFQAFSCDFVFSMEDQQDSTHTNNIEKKKSENSDFYKIQNLYKMHPQLHQKKSYNPLIALNPIEMKKIENIHNDIHNNQNIDDIHSQLGTIEQFHNQLHIYELQSENNRIASYH